MVIEACHYVPSLKPWDLMEREDGEFWIEWILASRNATLKAQATLNERR